MSLSDAIIDKRPLLQAVQNEFNKVSQEMMELQHQLRDGYERYENAKQNYQNNNLVPYQMFKGCYPNK